MQSNREGPRDDGRSSSSPTKNWRPAHVAKAILAGSLLLFALGTIVYSPFIMRRLAGEKSDWKSLSDVGQAYGGMSAVLAGLALCGVGASLVLQQRQARQERASGERQRHLELIKIAIDHPEFLEAVDIDLFEDARSSLLMYANLSVGHWLAAWELGESDDEELRTNLRTFFKSPISRAWWNNVGTHWVSQANGKRRRFISIMFEELFAAENRAESPPTSSVVPNHPGRVRERSARTPILLAAAVGFGLGIVTSGLNVNRRRKIP